jgi:mono/diheme cytochrome c family protein
MQLNQKEVFTSNSSPANVLRRLSWSAVIVLPVVMTALVTLPPPTSAAADTVSSRARHGEVIFKQRCISCHNKQPGDTSPFGPPNLSGIFRGPTPITIKQATDIIANGKATMPGWGTVLSKSDIGDVIAYLKTK